MKKLSLSQHCLLTCTPCGHKTLKRDYTGHISLQTPRSGNATSQILMMLCGFIINLLRETPLWMIH